MQEFSSISVSSYEAGSLADQLTERAKDGWSVVAIVPTGSSVTAYLSRESGAGAEPSAPAAAAAAPAAAPAAAQASADADSSDDEGSGDDDAAGESDGGSTTPDPVTEAPGWAASTTAAEPAPAPADTPSTGAAPASAPTSVPTSSGAAATTAAGAAPAGWYADPSSRFELRYWDGSQWTEHVSRGGQQHTDPPVA